MIQALCDLVITFQFFDYFTNKHQKVPRVNNQQKCLINGICGTFDIKSHNFGPAIPRNLKRFEKWVRG